MTEPFWIDVEDALDMHETMLARYGGPAGVRDLGLLESALARPRQRAAYAEASLVDLAAIYTEAVVRNHPFVDGNKRAGFVIGVVFLEANGLRLEADPDEAADVEIRLAAGEIGGEAYARFLKDRARRR